MEDQEWVDQALTLVTAKLRRTKNLLKLVFALVVVAAAATAFDNQVKKQLLAAAAELRGEIERARVARRPRGAAAKAAGDG